MSEKKQLVVGIHYDHDMFDPSAAGHGHGCGCWRIWSFNSNHIHHKSPADLGLCRDGSCDDKELQRKLDVGLAFNLGYFEHGECLWFLKGETPPGADCPWDGTPFAGIAIWEEPEENIGAKTLEERAKDCRGFMETYTAWCNGHGYGYSVVEVKDCGECSYEEEVADVDSCSGYYGNDLDHMFSCIQDATEGHEVVCVEGEASDLAQYHDVQKKETALA